MSLTFIDNFDKPTVWPNAQHYKGEELFVKLEGHKTGVPCFLFPKRFQNEAGNNRHFPNLEKAELIFKKQATTQSVVGKRNMFHRFSVD